MRNITNTEHVGTIKGITNNNILVELLDVPNCSACGSKSNCGLSNTGNKTIEVYDTSSQFSIGDTVLVIFNKEKYISLFAQTIQSNTSYRFWSPFYNTSGLGTIFYANFPFEPFKPTDNKTYGWNKKTYAQLQKYAKEEGYDFACQYHCMISKNEFWKYLEKIK